jgi:hypothetical protein
MKSKIKGMYHLKIKLMIRTILPPPRNMSANCQIHQSCKIKERRGIAWLLAGVCKLRGIWGGGGGEGKESCQLRMGISKKKHWNCQKQNK